MDPLFVVEIHDTNVWLTNGERHSNLCSALYIKGRKYFKIIKYSIIRRQSIHHYGISKYYILKYIYFCKMTG